MTQGKQQILRIGQEWPEQGGILAGMMRGENGAPDYFLILPTDPAAYKTEIEWGGYGQDEPGAKHEHDGRANTIALVESKIDHPAAQWAAGLTIAGHKDFYLPARRELRMLWCNVADQFEPGWYWSSTQASAYDAWDQNFVGGYQDGSVKNCRGRVRAVRRYVIE